MRNENAAVDTARRERRVILRALRDGELSPPGSCPVCRLKHRPRELDARLVGTYPLRVSWACKPCRRTEDDLVASSSSAPELPRFSGRVKRRRSDMGLSQKALADRAGLTVQTVSRIETGDASPTRRTLSKLALALGLRSGALC